MIRYLISDLDGTLFAGHGDTVFDLSDRNRKALSLLKENNIIFIPASGRMPQYCKKLLSLYHFQDKILEAYNGAVVENNGIPICLHTLSEDLVAEICQIAEFCKPVIQTIHGNRILPSDADKLIQHYQNETEKTGIGKVIISDIAEYFMQNPEDHMGKISLQFQDENTCKSVFQKLTADFKKQCTVFLTDSKLIEIQNKNASKHNIIDYLERHMNVSGNEIAVIGDGGNDMELYDDDCLKFAMNTGNEVLKEKADVIVRDVAEATDCIISRNNTFKKISHL